MSAIDSLDLRPELVILAERVVREDAEDRAAEDAKYARMWNWPTFPSRTAEFIETGRFPRHSWKTMVTIHLDTSRFELALAQAQLMLRSHYPVEGGVIIYKGSRWLRILHYFGLSPYKSHAYFNKTRSVGLTRWL